MSLPHRTGIASFSLNASSVLVALILSGSARSNMSAASLHGTLIAVAPTRDGIVMAADSRSTLGNRYCDGTYKLVEASHPQPTVIAVAGVGIIFLKPPPG